MPLIPSKTRLSPHFLLSDMMGCNSVYSKGLPNVFDKWPGTDIRLENGKALCEHALEPLLATVGSFSISYGFISPDLSDEIVTYQDPQKPSHHRWDLGAAVDICPHFHVLQSTSKHSTPESGAPILFALEHMQYLPLSRVITYSESPYVCVAVSAVEVLRGEARGAWYENRYTGKAGAKPRYLKYPSPNQRANALEKICDCGLEHGWVGGGYPSYHGGGRKQYQHMRASNYTMVSDFLYDEEFVMDGKRNIPSLLNKDVAFAFQLAGATYDWLLKMSGYPRLSIVSGYTSPTTPGWIAGRDWREGDVSFEIVPPAYVTPKDFIQQVFRADHEIGKHHMLFADIAMVAEDDRVIISVRRTIEW